MVLRKYMLKIPAPRESNLVPLNFESNYLKNDECYGDAVFGIRKRRKRRDTRFSTLKTCLEVLFSQEMALKLNFQISLMPFKQVWVNYDLRWYSSKSVEIFRFARTFP